MSGDTIVTAGAIGATQPGVTQYVLDAEQLIDEYTNELLGKKKVIHADGTVEYTASDDADESISYKPHVVNWMRSKLRGIMSKNTYLSYIGHENELEEVQWEIQNMFRKELFMHWHDFELDDRKFLQLKEMHFNALYFATQQILGGGVRKFLSQSTSETTSNVNQKLTEQQAKGNLVNRIFG